MTVQFPRGKIVGPEDLSISLVDSNGNPSDAYEISYALYDVSSGVEVPIGPTDRVPVHPELGLYYASFQIPEDANLGLYRIRWTFKQTSTSPENIVMEEFTVVLPEVMQDVLWTPTQAGMIQSLRILLRDHDPARNYHFRPPTTEGTISSKNRAFAYIWTDEELIEYMKRAVDFVNMWPPETHWNSIDSMVKAKPAWRQMILMGAISHAAMALTFHWSAEEFSYSIGGVSLDIDKSSKYESLKNNAESQLDKMLEAKTRTVKIIRGLKQSRYAQGLSSSLGPYVQSGIASPKNYLGF